MPQAGFEPWIPASERPQTHAFDCAAIGIGKRPSILCLTEHYAIKAYTGLEVQLHTYLTVTEVSGLLHTLAALPQRRNP